MTVLVWLGVALAGGIGAVARFVVDSSVASRRGRDFPYGTLVVNVSGAALLGLLTGVVLSDDAALVAGTGVIGAYTTFSTWLFETERLSEEREPANAAMNIVISLILGVAAAALGKAIGARL
ncbi:MAG TPA: fluoride efflux transporter CrcB [Mycobacteriales bacterium]|nr:fluoride efflux transporter CrcB [Mycobacteriales bacterium]